MVQYDGEQPISLAGPRKIISFLKGFLKKKGVIKKGDPLPLKKSIAHLSESFMRRHAHGYGLADMVCAYIIDMCVHQSLIDYI